MQLARRQLSCTGKQRRSSVNLFTRLSKDSLASLRGIWEDVRDLAFRQLGKNYSNSSLFFRAVVGSNRFSFTRLLATRNVREYVRQRKTWATILIKKYMGNVHHGRSLVNAIWTYSLAGNSWKTFFKFPHNFLLPFVFDDMRLQP